MSAGFLITIRNEHDEVVEYHCASSVLEIHVPEGRYVITVSSEAIDSVPPGGAAAGRLQ